MLITPKIHIVEHHIVDFLKMKHEEHGLGWWSEQAFEAMHSDMKRSGKRFKSVILITQNLDRDYSILLFVIMLDTFNSYNMLCKFCKNALFCHKYIVLIFYLGVILENIVLTGLISVFLELE